jgi:hypothetical protein
MIQKQLNMILKIIFVILMLSGIVLSSAVLSIEAFSAELEKYFDYTYGQEKWLELRNNKSGYEVKYPDIFGAGNKNSDLDSLYLSSDDNKYRLSVISSKNGLNENADARLRSRLKEVSHIIKGTIDFADSWYTVTYSDDGGRDGEEHLFFEYGIVNPDKWASFILTYPKSEEERFKKITKTMASSFIWINLECDNQEFMRNCSKNTDQIIFQEKDHPPLVILDNVIYKKGKIIEAEINRLPNNAASNEIKYWTVLGPETSDTISAEETGIWFFGSDGRSLKFIPLDSEGEFQGLEWSPAPGRFVVILGSAFRPDMTFKVYFDDKYIEFAGLRGDLKWLEDGLRLVFTQIDDVRDYKASGTLSFWFRLSAVMFDSAIDELFVLKQSSDLENFRFLSVSNNGASIAVRREFVTTAQQWSAEDSHQSEVIETEIPAAG